MSNGDIFQIVRLNELDNYRIDIEKIDINVTNEYSQNLLHEAIAFKSTEIALDLLGRKINVNQQDYCGMTPLHFAIAHKQAELCRAIIEAGADVNIRDSHGNDALWKATFWVVSAKERSEDKYEVVMLIVRKGGDALTGNNANRSPMDLAKQINDDKLIEILDGNN